jgi:HlyD family secretion protein
MMPEKETLVTHNESIQYLMNRRLSAFLRYGMSMLFLLSLGVLASLYFVKVPDVLEGRFSLSALQPPRAIIAKVNGRISEKMIGDKSIVKAGDLLLRIESTANPKEVEQLLIELKLIKQCLDSNRLDSIRLIDAEALYNLGELQQSYEQFKKNNNELYIALTKGQYLEERKIIEDRLNYLLLGKEQLNKQKQILQREFEMAQEAWQADSLLKRQGSLTLSELRASESNKLQKKLSLNNLVQSIISNENATNEIEQQMINLEKSIAVQKSMFTQAFGILWVAVADWQSKYMLRATSNGRVLLNRNLFEGMPIQVGDPLLFISPEDNTWIAEILITQQNFGKLKLGQRVILKFDGYRFEEFGMIEGKVKNLAQIPQEIKTSEGTSNKYLVEISLASKFTTSYQKTIQPFYGLNGDASIVLDDKNLLEKLFLEKWRTLIDN